MCPCRKHGNDMDDDDDDDDDEIGVTESGSTAVTCFIKGNIIYCANAGDSRAVICRAGGKAVNLSDDHKPTDEVEKARIEKANGFVEDKRYVFLLGMCFCLSTCLLSLRHCWS